MFNLTKRDKRSNLEKEIDRVLHLEVELLGHPAALCSNI